MNTPIDIIAFGKDQTVHLYANGQLYKTTQYSSPRHFMEALCLSNGTTLEGSYEASGVLLNHGYKRPIYIGGNCNQIYVPTTTLRNQFGTWISLNYLLTESLDNFNDYGYEILSIKSWQKHLSDGIALKQAVFNKKTVMMS